jgi:hypothetical protein
MGLKFRRGSTAQQSGSLAFGEPYVNTTLGTLVVGGATGDIVLSAGGTGSTGNFGAISGSGLDITGNANIAGNLTLGGNITIGDNTADNVTVVASLSSSIIPSLDSIFDLGSPTKQWRDLYLSSASLYIDGTQVLSSNATELIFTTDTGQSIKFNEVGTDNITLQTVDGDIELKSSGGGDVLLDPTTGIISVKGTVSMQDGTSKFLSSGGTNIVFGNDLVITGSITTTGAINGLTLSTGIVSSSAQTIANLPTGVVSGSAQTIANLPTGTVSGSSQVIGILSSLNTYTGSNDTTNTTQNTRLTALEASASTALSTNGTQATSITNLNSATASLLIETANLETFSSSALTRLDNLEGKDISITLTGDVTGTGTITNLANVSFATTIAANSVALGTDTTGDYVGSMTAGTGITVGTATGEGSTPVITNTGVTSNVAGTGVTVSGATGAVTISIGQAVATSSNVQFNSLGVGMAASATAGRIDATNDVVAFSSSDIRFKENIVPIENALDKISKISGNTYDWKAENKIEHGYEGNDVGVIAQEIEAVLPQLVQTRESGFKAVKYDKLVALLIQGIKEQQLQIEELKAKIGL